MMYLLLVIWLLLASSSDERTVPSPRYRISPLTGEKIALPTPEQLDWQAQELAVLIHFNMGTYVDIYDGCTHNMVPPISHFNPHLLSTDNWIQSAVNLGARHAVLTAKHTCGFLLSPTNVTFPLNPSGEIVPYNYTVAYSPMKSVNILDEFIKSCNKQNIRTGFYYSVGDNNFLNAHHGYVQNNTSQEGQLNITQSTYDDIVLRQLRELWTNYGSLNEIWFDGGYPQELRNSISAMLAELQPKSISFGGISLTPNAVRWVDNEFGNAPDPNWSTGTDGGGDPNSPTFCPAECDTTLQQFDRWFWAPLFPIRSLRELIDVYHHTVGRNCLLMLDLTPDRAGVIPTAHAQRYKELGDFIRSCYGHSIEPAFHNSSIDSRVYIQVFESPVRMDRSVLQEDQTNGQVIRAYVVHALVTVSKEQNEWIEVANGTSIGNKKIDLWSKGAQLVQAVKLNITATVDTPVLKAFTVHLCE